MEEGEKTERASGDRPNNKGGKSFQNTGGKKPPMRGNHESGSFWPHWDEYECGKIRISHGRGRRRKVRARIGGKEKAPTKGEGKDRARDWA